jgi:hypothetical protein
MSIVHKVRTALRLPRQDWHLIAQAWLLLPLSRLALRALPAGVRRRLLAGPPPIRESRLAAPQLWREAMRRKDAVDVASRNHLMTFRCVPRALVLRALLTRAGIPAELRIGVRKRDERLEAHAWLECYGRPLGETDDVAERFAVLESVEEYLERHLRTDES